MRTIFFILVATVGMSTDNYFVMSGALIICAILTLKSIKK